MMKHDYSELIEYITPSGEVFELHNPPNRVVLNDTGSGTPPIDYITQRGPLQHGESLVGLFLKPRVVQYTIRHQFCSRSNYWDGRALLLDTVRPNRPGLATVPAPGHLRRYQSNGVIRQLDVYITEGPAFTPRQQGVWDEWAFNEVLRFTAFNPVEYDPIQKTINEGLAVGDLQYPITYPIIYYTYYEDYVIPYKGTWPEYPTMIITGPLTNPSIVNSGTGVKLALNYEVAIGETVTFSLSYSMCRVTSSINGDLIPYLTPDSDLTGFYLAPNPEVAGGVNHLFISQVSGVADIQVFWYDRFIGN